jgi:RecA-family ATPase
MRSEDIGDEIKRRTLLREKLNRERNYIVDTIFPAGAMHLIGGPSGSGKTTWLLQQLYSWSLGEDVLGYNSHPCPWVYVSCDRSLRETDATMRRIGLGDWHAPMYAIEEVMGHQDATGALNDPSIFEIENHFPHAELIVVEGLQALLPDTGRGRSTNKSDLLWLIQVRDLILSKNKTIIATTHNPKSSQEYINERSNFLGTQSLIGGCSTLVSVDVPRDIKEQTDRRIAQQCTDREVIVLGRDYPNHYLSYTRGDNGTFEVSATLVTGRTAKGVIHQTQDDDRISLDTMLSVWPSSNVITITELREWQTKQGMSDRTFYRWLKDKTDQGRLLKEQRGVYSKVSTVLN